MGWGARGPAGSQLGWGRSRWLLELEQELLQQVLGQVPTQVWVQDQEEEWGLEPALVQGLEPGQKVLGSVQAMALV